MLIAIEGSHAAQLGVFVGQTTAREDYANSHVHRLHNQYTGGLAKYIYGPGPTTVLGSGRQIAFDVEANWTRWRHSDDGPLILAGWSRGAAICVFLANQLERFYDAQVHAMFLFDCVDMDPTISCNIVSDNVSHIFHAQRANWLTGANADALYVRARLRRSAGSSAAPPETEPFPGTHGDIGIYSEQPYTWMVSKARSVGVMF